MIDSYYVRLGPACHCGKDVGSLSGRGRPPKFCDDHKGKPKPPKDKRQTKECPVCRGFFTPLRDAQECCSRVCRYKNNGKHNPKGNLLGFKCSHCGASFESDHKGAMYCSKRCKQYAWIARNLVGNKHTHLHKHKQKQKLCAYWAGYCEVCHCAIGSKRIKKVCDSCRRTESLKAGRDAARNASEAIHKAAGKVVTCKECNCLFCPLYGAKDNTWCQPCARIGRKRTLRAHKASRRAREKGADCESVDPFKVFDRDKWKCQLCGINTPKAKRGTYADNAPELDHIIPLSKGGAHKYTNTQCTCRKCNGLKSDKPLGQLLMF